MSEIKGLKKRNALGKGLGALLSDAPAEQEAQPAAALPLERLDEILLSQIERNPYQPRIDFDETALLELAESIRVQGIIQPITVRRLSEDSYQLISGERRWQASKKVGLQKIPAYVRMASDTQMLEMALIENIQREDLNPIEVALSYQRLISECNLKQEELGDRVGKKRSTVTNYLRLLKLPVQIQQGLREQTLSMGHARALVNIDNMELQLFLYEKIGKEDLSVRRTEELVRDIIQGKDPLAKPAPAKPAPLSSELRRLQTSLSSHFGTQVKVKAQGEEKGEISIPYQSVEDLNRILEILNYHA